MKDSLKIRGGDKMPKDYETIITLRFIYEAENEPDAHHFLKQELKKLIEDVFESQFELCDIELTEVK